MSMSNELNTKPPGYITLAEFTQRSGYTNRTLMRWLANGKLTGTFDKHAGKWLISEAEFERVQSQGVIDKRRKINK